MVTLDHDKETHCFQDQDQHFSTQGRILSQQTASQPPAPLPSLSQQWLEDPQNIGPDDHLAIRLMHLWPHLTDDQCSAVFNYVIKLLDRLYY